MQNTQESRTSSEAWRLAIYHTTKLARLTQVSLSVGLDAEACRAVILGGADALVPLVSAGLFRLLLVRLDDADTVIAERLGLALWPRFCGCGRGRGLTVVLEPGDRGRADTAAAAPGILSAVWGLVGEVGLVLYVGGGGERASEVVEGDLRGMLGEQTLELGDTLLDLGEVSGYVSAPGFGQHWQ